MSKLLRTTLILTLGLLALAFAAPAGAQQDAADDSSASEQQAAESDSGEDAEAQPEDRRYRKVGVALFDNRSDVDDGGKRLSRHIFNYLKKQADEVEFVKVSRGPDPGDPIGPSEARHIGEEYGVGAVVWGHMGEIKVPSGQFPSRTNSRPMARSRAIINVTETGEGRQLINYLLYDEGMRHYGWDARTMEELENYALRYIADTAWKVLKDEAIFYGEEPDLDARDRRREKQAKLKKRLRNEDDGGGGTSISPF